MDAISGVRHEDWYDRSKGVKAFDDTKAGVKGLVDAGILKVPNIFIGPPNKDLTHHDQFLTCQQTHLQVPVIDLHGINGDRHKQVVDEVLTASKAWGFFQVVNHVIPVSVLESVIQGLCRFNEQDLEVKKEFYTRDMTRTVRFNYNYDLYQSRIANWRDTLAFTKDAVDLDLKALSAVCRYFAQ